MPETLRSKTIRLAATLPKGSARSALLNVLGSSDLDSDVLDTLQRIHSDRRLMHGWDRDVAKAYNVLNNAGEGYSIGDDNDDIASIKEAGRLIDTVDNGSIAVYWKPKMLTLVGDSHGPWAVNVKF